MNFTTESKAEDRKVEAYLINRHGRIGALPRHFGQHAPIFEGFIYDLMRQFSQDYQGGMWEMFQLSNGGLLMTPPNPTLNINIPSNGYVGQMTGEAAGITVCLFAFSHLSFRFRHTEVFSRHFYRLRDFALGHPESAEIFAAID